MADSVSTEAWLDQRRWAALEEALKAQGSNVKRHLQDYLITLYNETVPLERWVQIETAITKEELESAQAAEDQKVYAAFHIRENGHDSIFSTGNGEEFLDVAIRLRRYLQGDAEAVKGGFSHHFYKTQPITRERFDELAALRLENTGKVSGAFEIDLDAGWCSALNLADGWQTFKNKDVSTAAYHANRTRNLQRNEQWRRLVDYLYGRNIELQTFGSIETRGIRPLREGDLTFSEEIILSGQRQKVKDFFIKFTKKSHFADFLTEQTLDFVLHRLFCGLAEMDTDDIGCLADLLSDSRASGGVGCGIVHSKSSCK